MSKDPFQILADEITLIRTEIEKLQRTSLNKDEAKALNKIVATGVADLQKASPALERSMERQLGMSMDVVRDEAIKAAKDAAECAVTHSHGEASQAAQTLLQEAHRARRIALQHQGRFWSWMAVSGAVCACLAILATVAVQGRGDAEAFGLLPRLFCERAGGENLTTKDGRSGCMVWHSGQ